MNLEEVKKLNILNFIRDIFIKKSPAKERIEPVLSVTMQSNLELWSNMYSSSGLQLSSVISSEFSRLILSESNIQISGNNFLNEQLSKFLVNLSDKLEIACALGGMIFKPYVSNSQIIVDLVRADCFAPIAFNANGDITSAVFIDKKTVGQCYYTRTEIHALNVENETYTVTNTAYKSYDSSVQGVVCSLSEVPEWSDLSEEQTIKNIKKPLFSYFRIPFANNSDLDSPLGVSVYSRAVDLIHQADEHWKRILWEYEGTELAIDASNDVLNGKKLDRHEKRLYRFHDIDTINGSMFNAFSPAIRDNSLFNGFNKILQRIEFNCGLAYGTISEPMEIEKTATEILSSKQRSYTHVSAIQRNLESALENLLYAMKIYAVLYNLDSTDCELSCTWGDSVLEDAEKEFQRRLQMVSAGILSKEKFISWYFNCSDKEVSEYLPANVDLFGGA